MQKTKKIIIANWKMNPEKSPEAKKIFLSIKKTINKLLNVQIIVCPPYVFLNELMVLCSGRIVVGAQNVFSKNKGSFTGMISPNMLSKNGIKYVILGHSERRFLGENDEIVNKKVKIALKSGLKVILCIGEKERDKDVKYFNFLKNQILGSLDGVSKKYLKNILIAYEPLWAISTNKGKAINPANLYEMVIFIKKVLSDKYGVDIKFPKIVYGGSVNPKNTKQFLEEGGIDGLLIGRDSLNIDKFIEILKITNKSNLLK